MFYFFNLLATSSALQKTITKIIVLNNLGYCKNINRGIFYVCTLFNTAAYQIPLCRRMLGSNPASSDPKMLGSICCHRRNTTFSQHKIAILENFSTPPIKKWKALVATTVNYIPGGQIHRISGLWASPKKFEIMLQIKLVISDLSGAKNPFLPAIHKIKNK